MKSKYRVIYQPKGAAKEYSDLALNLFKGCNHGCKYCYAPSCTFTSREEFNSTQSIRRNILNLLEQDLIEMKLFDDKRRVLFCFITDPYQGGAEFNGITRDAIGLFNKYNQPMQILTKGGLKAIRDFDLYKKSDAYAATLTFYDKDKSLGWEPKAAIPIDRIKSLEIAKSKNIETWASFEPVIEPEETYKLFEATKDFTDIYKIGKINHFKTDYVDWQKFTNKIIDMCHKNNKNYYIKDSLKPYVSP